MIVLQNDCDGGECCIVCGSAIGNRHDFDCRIAVLAQQRDKLFGILYALVREDRDSRTHGVETYEKGSLMWNLWEKARDHIAEIEQTTKEAT